MRGGRYSEPGGPLSTVICQNAIWVGFPLTWCYLVTQIVSQSTKALAESKYKSHNKPSFASECNYDTLTQHTFLLNLERTWMFECNSPRGSHGFRKVSAVFCLFIFSHVSFNGDLVGNGLNTFVWIQRSVCSKC